MAKKKTKQNNDSDIGCFVFVLLGGVGAFLSNEIVWGIVLIVFALILIILYSSSDNTDVNSLDGVQFEQYCGNLLLQRGFYGIKYTPTTGDQGVDILAYKDGKRYAVQCKRYSHKVGNKPVQEVYAGMIFYGCDIAMVMTNNTFTDGARDLAHRTGVILWDNVR